MDTFGLSVGMMMYRPDNESTILFSFFSWGLGLVNLQQVINSSGYRIGPFEVESALKEHPAVVESAVVGAPDPIRHTIVKAFVILTPEYQSVHDNPTKAKELVKELQGFVKRGTGPYKYPRAIEFVKELPKTVSGKIRRVELRLKEWEGYDKDGKKLAKL
jgi:acyl-coenzyme A synthetase/AMP-(fatty) acid ligase